MATNALPVEFLRTCLSYDPETGKFRWKARPESHFADPRVHTRWNRHKAGTRAFVAKNRRGYLRATLTYEGQEIEILAQRAAWVLMTGEYPANQVDHIDGNPSDNRFANLREATQSQNNMNRRRNRAMKSPFKGTGFSNGRWHAQICRDGKSTFLGCFDTAEQAHAAYVSAANQRFGEFARAA